MLDGDTIVVDGTHVRVIGIDTPEIAHDAPAACYGDVAAAFVRDALLGQRVRHRDRRPSRTTSTAARWPT